MNDPFAKEIVKTETERKFPEKYKPKAKSKKQSPANALTDSICKYIKLNSGIAYRVNSQGQYDAKLGRWRKSGMKKGLPDIIAIYNGLFVGIEVKIGRDKQSEDQKLREEEIEKAGGVYYIAKEFDSFKEYFDDNIM